MWNMHWWWFVLSLPILLASLFCSEVKYYIKRHCFIYSFMFLYQRFLHHFRKDQKKYGLETSCRPLNSIWYVAHPKLQHVLSFSLEAARGLLEALRSLRARGSRTIPTFLGRLRARALVGIVVSSGTVAMRSSVARLIRSSSASPSRLRWELPPLVWCASAVVSADMFLEGKG